MSSVVSTVVEAAPKVVLGKAVREFVQGVRLGVTRNIPKYIKGVLRQATRQAVAKGGGIKQLALVAKGILQIPLNNEQRMNLLKSAYYAGARSNTRVQATTELKVLAELTKGTRTLNDIQRVIDAIRKGAVDDKIAKQYKIVQAANYAYKGTKDLVATATYGGTEKIKDTAKDYLIGDAVLKSAGAASAFLGTSGGIVLGNKISKDLDKKNK